MSIRTKIVALVMAVAALALLLMSASLFAVDDVTSSGSLPARMQMVAVSAAAALGLTLVVAVLVSPLFQRMLLAREREANRLKDEFLMTLSHDLRTPLNTIQGWASLIRTGVVPAAGVPEAAERIERNAKAQTRLIEDLLELSKVTTGQRGGIATASRSPGEDPARAGRPPVPMRIATPPLARPEGAGTLQGISILVVDDDADGREVLATLLQAAGAMVRQAANVADAVTALRERSFDALISDIAMPGHNGYDLIRAVSRERDLHRPRLAIALTAHTTTMDRDTALAAGFDRHVEKPCDQHALIDFLREPLTRK
jgi:CheY-like chemotaxis protein